MHISTLSEIIRQKNLANLPVLNYREEKGKAFIELQLRTALAESAETSYDSAKLISRFRAMQFSLDRTTNVTKDIRRERDSSPSVERLGHQPKET